ncbi:hypothetical protein SteCoe_35787 [Stentor coeruleus]|uniref:Uncharacterized protein n=1 Tax=Stentor coeruleus TaxID=5963 RepID=A0A1R2ARJ5_9CILI|nr:hypothetical protein SteCoe_35787 [Stentor coeruleus]
MSSLDTSSPISPLKSRPRIWKSPNNFIMSSSKSSKSISSLQKDKEIRARITIRKLLEDEANKNEELAEENEILSKQIKSLIALLVEKDEKIMDLNKNEQNPKEKIEEFVYKIDRIIKKKLRLFVAFGFCKVFHEKTRKNNLFKEFFLRNKRICRIGLRFCHEGIQRIVKKSKINVRRLNKILNKRLRIVFNDILLQKSGFNHTLKFFEILQCRIKGINCVQKLRNYWKRWIRYNKTIKSINRYNRGGITINSIDSKYAGFLLVKSVISCQKQKYFLDIRKSLLRKSFSKSNFHTNALRLSLTQNSSSKNLSTLFNSITDLFETTNQILSRQSSYTETISKLDYEITFLTTENSTLTNTLSSKTEKLQNLSSTLETSSKHYQTLQEKASDQIQLLETFTSKSSNFQSKYDQESSSLHEKIKKQQDFIKAAHTKLQQLINKQKQMTEENDLIKNQSTSIQMTIQKIHKNYAKVVEEKAKFQVSENETKNELGSLYHTSQVLENETNTLKSQLKNLISELENLKEEYGNKLLTIENLEGKISEYKEYDEHLAGEIQNLEQEIDKEYETKEFKLQECQAEIQTTKDLISKARKDMENLKSQLKEVSDKNKFYSQKPFEEYSVVTKKYEESKKVLTNLKNSVLTISSSIASNQKEISETKFAIRASKEDIEKKKLENSLLENKISLVSINMQENKKNKKVKRKNREELETYIKTLELQLQKLRENHLKQTNYDVEHLKGEIIIMGIQAEKMERELIYVKEEAAQRRLEVAQVKPEIENYANILAALEEKIAENEDRMLQVEVERDKIKAEIKIVRNRYINMIAG